MTSQLLATQLPDDLQLGQTVFIPQFEPPRKGHVVETKITHFVAAVYQENGVMQAVTTDVGVSNIDFARPHERASTYRPHELYLSEEAARHALVFRAVTCSEGDWQKITGCTAQGARVEEKMDGAPEVATLDDCELPPCCGNISDIRDILVKAWQNAGLYQVDVERLAMLVGSHDAPTSINRLNHVLAQVGIVWH